MIKYANIKYDLKMMIKIFLFIAQDAEIIRTRDPTQLAECDIVVDVGGEFDPKRHRYDHHQRYYFGHLLLITCHGKGIAGLF